MVADLRRGSLDDRHIFGVVGLHNGVGNPAGAAAGDVYLPPGGIGITAYDRHFGVWIEGADDRIFGAGAGANVNGTR